MKIIGKTATRYLVEIDETELANAAGFRFIHDMEKHDSIEKVSTGYGYRSQFRIGTTIEVAKTHAYLQSLRDHETKVRGSAAVLRGMADMLDAALPTTMVPPPQEEPTTNG